MTHCPAKVLALPLEVGFASRFFWLCFRVSAAFFGGSKNWSEVSVKLQYIVLTLLLPAIYCFGTLVVCSGLGDEEMFS